MNKYYVYAFLDGSKPGNYQYGEYFFEFEPFYIGKGCDDRIHHSKFDRYSPLKTRKINKITRNGGEVIAIKILDGLENLRSLDMEKLLISIIGRRDMGLGPLTNQTDGGDGRLNSHHSDETKRKISLTKISQNRRGRKLPESQIEYLRQINKGEKNPMFGRTHTDEVKEDHSKKVSGLNHPMFGKVHSLEVIDKIKKNRSIHQEKSNQISKEFNSKRVLQYSLSGEFIKEFDSIKEASKHTGLSESLIGKTCRGVVKNPRKFIFKFKEEKDSVYRNSFELKIGDQFIYDDQLYILIKRNKKSAIAELDGSTISIRSKDLPILFQKKKSG